MNFFSYIKKQAAFKITELIVVVGIGGIVLAAVGGTFKWGSAYYKKLQISHANLDASIKGIMRPDCYRTLQAEYGVNDCPGAWTPINLRDDSGTVLIADPSSVISGVTHRALCRNTDHMNEIRLQQRVGGVWQNFGAILRCYPRFLTNAPTHWGWSNRIFAGAFTCGSHAACFVDQATGVSFDFPGTSYEADFISARMACRAIAPWTVLGTAVNHVNSSPPDNGIRRWNVATKRFNRVNPPTSTQISGPPNCRRR